MSLHRVSFFRSPFHSFTLKMYGAISRLNDRFFGTQTLPMTRIARFNFFLKCRNILCLPTHTTTHPPSHTSCLASRTQQDPDCRPGTHPFPVHHPSFSSLASPSSSSSIGRVSEKRWICVKKRFFFSPQKRRTKKSSTLIVPSFIVLGTQKPADLHFRSTLGVCFVWQNKFEN